MHASIRRLLALAALVATLAPAARPAAPAAPLPLGSAQELGFAPDRLDRVDASLRALVDEGRCSGFVTLLARHGRIADWRSYGWRDLAAKAPMEKDTIVHIYSNTKLITAVGAMILFEEGRLDLDAPVERYLPALKDRLVLTGGTPAAPVTVPAKRPMTIRDLLTHTSGFAYDFGGDDTLSLLYRQANLWEAASLDDFVARAATLPLHHQPGDAFAYGISMDVLGAVLEKVTGQRLEAFLQERLLGPLGMVDTGFDVAPGKMNRLAKVYQRDPRGRLVEAPPDSSSLPEPGRGFPSGGGGLFSTAGDYARFAQMLLNGGRLDGVRILSRKTVEYMTLNHLARTGKPTHAYADGRGFGLGAEVMIDLARDRTLGSPGQFGWYGLATTYCQIDPSEDLVAIAFFQHFPMNEIGIFQRFPNGYYSALVDDR